MKTTLDIPDDLMRRAKATAALKGQSLKDFVTVALKEKLARKQEVLEAERGWRMAFGKVSRKHVREVDALIREEFSKIDPEEWK